MNETYNCSMCDAVGDYNEWEYEIEGPQGCGTYAVFCSSDCLRRWSADAEATVEKYYERWLKGLTEELPGAGTAPGLEQSSQ